MTKKIKLITVRVDGRIIKTNDPNYVLKCLGYFTK